MLDVGVPPELHQAKGSLSTTLQKMILSAEFIGVVARAIYNPKRDDVNSNNVASLGDKLFKRSYKPLFDRLGKTNACTCPPDAWEPVAVASLAAAAGSGSTTASFGVFASALAATFNAGSVATKQTEHGAREVMLLSWIETVFPRIIEPPSAMCQFLACLSAVHAVLGGVMPTS